MVRTDRMGHEMGGLLRVRLGVSVAILTASSLLAACAGSDVAEAPRGSADPPATTAVTVTDSTELIDRLMRIEDIRPIAAFGLDTREQPVLDPQQFALATLRGPCGATIDTPFAEAGVFRVFRSTVSLVVEAVAQPGAEAASAFVDGLRADAIDGCPPFTEQLGSAEPSTLTLEEMLDLDDLGEEWIGWTQAVSTATGPVGHRAILVAAEGDRLWLIAVLSPAPIGTADLVGLGRIASERAAG